jgi:predicted RNA-binding Zn-ribbon protein involved in translation (DUF1610 family)
MPISFSCPNCGKKLKAPDSAVGKSSKCPQCGSTVTCPEPVYDAELIEAPGGVDPYADLDSDKPYAMVAPEPAAGQGSEAEGRRPCPMCGEMIVATAAKCRYCGEIFDPALKKAKSKKKRQTAEDEDLSTGDMIVAVICSGIGCIASIVWMIQGKPKGIKMFGLSLAMVIFWNVVMYFVRTATQGPGGMGGP